MISSGLKWVDALYFQYPLVTRGRWRTVTCVLAVTRGGRNTRKPEGVQVSCKSGFPQAVAAIESFSSWGGILLKWGSLALANVFSNSLV